MAAKYLTVDHLPLKDIIRIFSQVNIDFLVQFNGTPCWTWTGTIFKFSGYGRINRGYRHTESLHRVIYAWLVGPLPKRVAGEKTPNLDHLCRNKLCCNPVHLELVPPRVNILRAMTPSAKNANKTHCIAGHPFDEVNTIWDTPTHRSCRTCRQEKAKRQREAPGYKEKMKIYEARYFAKIGQEARRERWRATYYRLKDRNPNYREHANRLRRERKARKRLRDSSGSSDNLAP